MTASQYLAKGPVIVRQERKTLLSLFGVSLLALSLAAGSVAAAEAKAANTEASAQSESAKPSAKASTTKADTAKASDGKADSATKKTTKKTETASADDSDGKAAKSSVKSTEKTSDKTSGKTTTKTKLADADDGKSETSKSGKPAKAADKGKLADADGVKSAGSKKADNTEKAGKGKTMLADADDAKPAKGAKGKATESKSDEKSSDAKAKASHGKTELADADDDIKPAKGSAKSASAKTAKSKAELADSDDVKGSKSAKAKAGRAELADSDDEDDGIKAIKSGKVRVVKAKLEKPVDAACKPAKATKKSKSSRRKKAAVCKISKEDMALANALTKANATLSNAASRARFLPQGQSDAPVTQASLSGTPLNAGPVPYTRNATPGILSDQDLVLYRTAFSAIDAGNFDDADDSLAQVTDRSLVGYAEYHILLSTKYNASYDELVAWLGQYGDQPTAMKVWTLAKRKKPQGAPDPAFPSLNGAPPPTALQASAGDAVQLSANASLAPQPLQADFNPGAPQVDRADSDLTPKSARSAYNNGQMEQAVVLANKIGDHWVAGLANWRLKRYDQALTEFKFVSTDPSRNAWSQSSGAYWAARSALKLGDAGQADTYFKIAASFPFTFYGLLAEARLGVTPAVALSKKGLPPTYQGSMRNALAASLQNDSTWAQTNVQARRMSALVQVGRMTDAQTEAQKGMQTAADSGERDRWLALAAANRVRIGQLMTTDKLFDASLYPIPEYTLKNGGTGVDRALVFAFARKESKFNASAKSFAGAYGLMQLMPGTAALVENDSSFNSQPSKLLKPATNLRVGQKYIQRLMNSKPVGGDLLRTIAAYNAGPRPVQDAMNSVGAENDALLVMESIPVAETRQYVEEVAANYWIYRQLMGKPTPSLSQAAADAGVIDATTDAEKDVAGEDDDVKDVAVNDGAAKTSVAMVGGAR